MRAFDFSNPELWRFKAICYLSDPCSEEWAEYVDYLMEEMAALNDALDCDVWDYDTAKANAPEDSRFGIKGTCDHCGAWFKYGAAYENVESGEVAITGHICATNYLNLSGSEYANKRLREAAKRARSRAEADRKFAALAPNRREALELDHGISRDLKRNFRKWGNLTKRQWELAKKLVKDDARYKAEKAAEPEPKPLPEELLDGRATFTGTVLGTKSEEGFYGYTLKMLFRDDRGFKLWGTVPSGLDAGKGDRVRFDAAASASNDDPCFGFYKRPTKPETLEYAEGDL